MSLDTMADTIEKHTPDNLEDLDAPFAGVDVKLGRIRDVQALHTTRFNKLEIRLNELQRNMDSRFDGMSGKLDKILQRLPPKA
jgi:hypothetical protein